MYPDQTPSNQPQPIVNKPLPASKSGPNLAILVIVALFALLVGVGAGYLAGVTGANTEYEKKITALAKENEELNQELSIFAIGGDDSTSRESYLEIPEWNIRLPYPEKYTDVVYRIKNELGTQYVELTSKSLADLSTCVNYDGQVGTITRADAGTVPEPTKHVTGLKGKIYMYKPHQQTCTSNPQGLEAPYKAAILEQFSLLENIPARRVNAN